MGNFDTLNKASLHCAFDSLQKQNVERDSLFRSDVESLNHLLEALRVPIRIDPIRIGDLLAGDLVMANVEFPFTGL